MDVPEPYRKPRLRDGTMRLGVFWPYSRTLVPSQLLSERNPELLQLRNHIALIEALEQAGIDFVVIADGYTPISEAGSRVGFQDPRTHALLWAVPLILATRHIGIISTMHTNYMHPVHHARFAGHLNSLSGGRWGWNIVNGFRESEALLFGLDGLPDHDGAYDTADEVLEVVEKLWTGLPVAHEGPKYRVRGKLSGPLPDERPLLVSAASSPRGRTFAARHCDYLFASPPGFEGIPALRDDLASRMPEGAGNPPDILVLCDLLIRDTPGEARRDYDEIMNSMDPEAQGQWRASLSKLNTQPGQRGRELLGTAEEVAAQIIDLRTNYGVNGLLFRMLYWDEAEARRIAPMLALLQQHGVWRPPQDRGHSW